MVNRKTRLKLKHQDMAVNADIRTAKLSPENIVEHPETVRRDEQSGSLVIRQTYDKATGEALADGYGYRWVNEDGEEVPKEDIQLYAVEDDEERPFSKHESTLGAERTVSAETWIPVAEIDEYLIEKIYELWGETNEDVVQLYELAEHIRDFDEAPVIPFVLQASKYKSWGIITPFFFEDSFSLIIRVTDQKIEPEHRMPMLSAADLDELEAGEEDAPTLEQESPFG